MVWGRNRELKDSGAHPSTADFWFECGQGAAPRVLIFPVSKVKAST